MENDLDFGDAHYHGDGGPVTIYRNPLSRLGKVDLALIEAGLDLGYPWCPDLNAPGSTGISSLPMNRTVDNRVSTNDAYLEPARNRPNLTIVGDTHVDRVVFAATKAVGVSALNGGTAIEFAGREVILSAGSTFTPPILIRSGIGPAQQLQALGISPLRDLPVGMNVLDHAVAACSLTLRPEARATSIDERLLGCSIRYSSGLVGAVTNDMIITSLNQRTYDADDLVEGFIGVALWQVFSSGELRVVDPDPYAMPQIDERLLSDERDLLRMRAGARNLFRIARHPAVRAISESVSLGMADSGLPALAIEDVVQDRALDQWLLQTVMHSWHLAGTCRMGSPDDPRTVVGPDCRVIGTEGLRVIDASIMPVMPRANTNLPCLAIGEHMAVRLRTRESVDLTSSQRKGERFI